MVECTSIFIQFIERYSFVIRENQDGIMKPHMIYQAAIASRVDENYFSLDLEDMLVSKYFETTCHYAKKGKGKAEIL